MPITYPSLLALLLLSATAGAAPPPGHPDVETANRVLGLAPGPATLPFSGTVIEAEDSNNYTYLYVDTGSEKRWIVAPRLRIAPGDTVRYADGRTMSNFYSKKLRRIFAEVTFVPRAVALP